MTSSARFALAFCAAFLLTCLTLFADGGALLLHQQAGALILSVFGSPAPLRTDIADLSVMVQNASDQSLLLDADLTLRLTKPGQPEILLRPTHSEATDKLLYAAQFKFPADGDWQLSVMCRSGDQHASISGMIAVSPAEPPLLTYWPYFALVPAGVLLFILNQRLKRKRRVRNPRARP